MSPNERLVHRIGIPSSEPARAALTYPLVLVFALALGFAGWLMSQGYFWIDATLITFSIIAGTMVITKTPWGGMARALRRLRLRLVREDAERTEAVSR